MGFKVMQIEASNYCSLKCIYCPHPKQVRAKGDMTLPTFAKCIELVRRSDNPVHADGRKFVWLNHFGEPLLNPLLPDFIRLAAESAIHVSFASNGVDDEGRLFPRALWQALAEAGLKEVMLSAHKINADVLRAHVNDIVEVKWMFEPRTANLHDWAGQVDMAKFKLQPLPVPTSPCDYETHHMFAVTWDGRLAACCYDSEGLAGLSVDDVLRDGFSFRPVSLCANCRLGRGDASWLS